MAYGLCIIEVHTWHMGYGLLKYILDPWAMRHCLVSRDIDRVVMCSVSWGVDYAIRHLASRGMGHVNRQSSIGSGGLTLGRLFSWLKA